MLCMRHITIENGKIDLLPLIPEKTESGYDIKIEKFFKGKEEWLRIYYVHPRKPELKIRRFVDAKMFGSLLGQMQAEGTKVGKKFRLEFANKLIHEHKDFVESLEALGIPRSKISFYLIDSGSEDDESLKKYSKRFKKIIGFSPKIYHHHSMRGGVGFKSIIRNTILTELVLKSMDLFRKLIPKYSGKIELISNSFFAKLLTGDGTLDIDKRITPRVSIRIVDRNLEYLKDYEKIFKSLGFNWTYLDEKRISVKASCSFENLLYLYKIRAFKNTNNWNKLLVAIGLFLKGRRIRTLLRFLDLEKIDSFTSFYIRDKYSVCLRSANDWLHNMRRKGYIRCVDRRNRPYKYQLTKKAISLCKILKEWKRDLIKLMELKKIYDLCELLESLKVRAN